MTSSQQPSQAGVPLTRLAVGVGTLLARWHGEEILTSHADALAHIDDAMSANGARRLPTHRPLSSACCSSFRRTH